MASLKKRRIRGDMIAVFQYLKGCHKEEGANLISKTPEGRTRNNACKIRRESTRILSEDNQRNSFPLDIVVASSLDFLKKRLDSHLSERDSFGISIDPEMV
uniref:Uncharacterized protein n=1 Tax=Micrurus lemniscatus lemniscatus TaxID=129467 RepID=A0A2D4HDB1_MICLE